MKRDGPAREFYLKRVKLSGEGFIIGHEEVKAIYEANDGYNTIRCDMGLDYGGTRDT